jgi:hypothetical protein
MSTPPRVLVTMPPHVAAGTEPFGHESRVDRDHHITRRPFDTFHESPGGLAQKVGSGSR